MADALGMIETRSFPAVVEAADAAVKAAKVELVTYEKTGGGYVSVVVRGDLAAVKAACDAAQVAAGRIGEVVAVHIIARPHVNVDLVMPLGRAAEAKAAKKEGTRSTAGSDRADRRPPGRAGDDVPTVRPHPGEKVRPCSLPRSWGPSWRRGRRRASTD